MDFLTKKIFTPAFLITLLRYGLVAIGAWLVANAGFDPTSWDAIAGAILVIANALFGATESTKDKAVVEGKTVDVAKLPHGVQNQLEVAASVTPKRSLFDLFIGK